jgi:hypothetical protein
MAQLDVSATIHPLDHDLLLVTIETEGAPQDSPSGARA